MVGQSTCCCGMGCACDACKDGGALNDAGADIADGGSCVGGIVLFTYAGLAYMEENRSTGTAAAAKDDDDGIAGAAMEAEEAWKSEVRTGLVAEHENTRRRERYVNTCILLYHHEHV